jgi:hypothetical protein
MSAIQSLIARLNALEEKVELLSLCTPLEALNEGLKGASEDKKREYVTLLKAMIDEHWSPEGPQPAITAKAAGLSIKVPAKAAKEEKPKRAATNPEGPAAYNAKLQEVWQQMVEEAGVEVEEGKLIEAAKTAGISYRAAQRETSIRQIMEQEGKDHEEAEALFDGRKADAAAAKEAKKAGTPKPAPTVAPKPTAAKASTPKAPKAAKAAAPKAEAAKAEAPKAEAEVIAAASSASFSAASLAPLKPVATLAAAASASSSPAFSPHTPPSTSEEAEFAAKLAEANIKETTIKGQVYYVDQDSMEVFGPKKAGVFELGDCVGMYNAKKGSIVKSEA